jgi:hypothetical protein
MARYVFTPSSITSTGRFQNVTFWDRQVSGSQIRDLYATDGSDNISDPIPNGVVITTNAIGGMPTIIGPNEVSSMWMRVGDSPSRARVDAVRPVASSERTTKPAVTGSRAANAALASLLTALASAGIITDSTSA